MTVRVNIVLLLFSGIQDAEPIIFGEYKKIPGICNYLHYGKLCLPLLN